MGDAFHRVSGAINTKRRPGPNVFCRELISHRQGPAESAPTAACASGFKASLGAEGLGGAFRSAGSGERKEDVLTLGGCESNDTVVVPRTCQNRP